MVLDPARVPADEILPQLLDRRGDDRVVGPQAGLAVADEVLVGVHAHQQAAAGQEALQAGYLHCGTGAYVSGRSASEPMVRIDPAGGKESATPVR